MFDSTMGRISCFAILILLYSRHRDVGRNLAKVNLVMTGQITSKSKGFYLRLSITGLTRVGVNVLPVIDSRG